MKITTSSIEGQRNNGFYLFNKHSNQIISSRYKQNLCFRFLTKSGLLSLFIGYVVMCYLSALYFDPIAGITIWQLVNAMHD